MEIEIFEIIRLKLNQIYEGNMSGKKFKFHFYKISKKNYHEDYSLKLSFDGKDQVYLVNEDLASTSLNYLKFEAYYTDDSEEISISVQKLDDFLTVQKSEINFKVAEQDNDNIKIIMDSSFKVDIIWPKSKTKIQN